MDAKYEVTIRHAPGSETDAVPWRAEVRRTDGGVLISDTGNTTDVRVQFGSTRDEAIERAEGIIRNNETAQAEPETLYYDERAEQVPQIRSAS